MDRTVKTKAAILMVVLLAVALVPTTAQAKQTAEPTQVTNGGTLTYLGSSLPQTADPNVAYDFYSMGLVQNTYETLVRYDPANPGEVAPNLASSWDQSDDGLLYTYHLRTDVRFSDGSPMTAYDVAFSLKRVLLVNDWNGPGWMLGEHLVEGFYEWFDPSAVDEAIIALDPQTVQIRLIEPYSGFNQIMASTVCSIMSQTFVSANEPLPDPLADPWMRTHTMGTGPYFVESWVDYDYVILKANPWYWRGQASIGTVVLKEVWDSATRTMMLVAGDADIVQTTHEERSTFEGLDGITTVDGGLQYWIDTLGFNQNINSMSGVGDVPATFFADQHVRSAFVEAFDYANYRSLRPGAYLPLNGLIPYNMFGYDGSIMNPSKNLALAADELSQAVNPSTGDSYLEEGFTLDIFYNVGNSNREYACNLLKLGLESLSENIHINVIGLEWVDYLDRRANGGLPMLYLGWLADYPDPDNMVTPFLASDGLFAPSLSINDAEIDQWIGEARTTASPDDRVEIYHDIEQKLTDQAYYLFLGQCNKMPLAMRSCVSGYNPDPMAQDLIFYDLDKEIEVDINVNPHKAMSTINLHGVVQVAVLSAITFDAKGIAPNTITFAGAPSLHWYVADVNNDGLKDIVLLFQGSSLTLSSGEQQVQLFGELKDGSRFFGTSEVVVR